MKNIFYKYPECEPMKTNYYLCSLKYTDKGGFHQFIELFYSKGEGFKNVPKGLNVVAFTLLTPEEAAKNAQI